MPGISSRRKLFLTAKEYRIVMAEQASDYIGSLWICDVADEIGYAAPRDDLQRIIDATLTASLVYAQGVSDCDDFNRKLLARVLVNAFLDDAYREIDGKRVRRPPYLVGEANTAGHAFNHAIEDDHGKPNLVIIEPQLGKIYEPADFPWDSALLETRV